MAGSETVSQAELLRAVRGSEIPLKLTLASAEVTAIEAPPPLYVMGARLGWLQTLAEKAMPFFQHVLPPGEDMPWFEYKGLPLRWQYPLGLLYDLLAVDRDRPWSLTIHFREFPKESLLNFEGTASLRAAYFNSLKEAACICTGGAQPVMQMAGAAQDDLWRAVLRADQTRWAEVSSGMGLAPVAGRGGRKPTLPLRVFLRMGGCGYLTGYESVHYTSRPAAALGADGQPQTLGDFLLGILPSLPDATPSDEPRGGEASTSARDDSEPNEEVPAQEGRPAEDSWQRAGEKLRHGGRAVAVRICGIAPPLDSPLSWLYSVFRSLDNFLYVVVDVS